MRRPAFSLRGVRFALSEQSDEAISMHGFLMPIPLQALLQQAREIAATQIRVQGTRRVPGTQDTQQMDCQRLQSRQNYPLSPAPGGKSLDRERLGGFIWRARRWLRRRFDQVERTEGELG